jgi:hypothetical protein
MSKSESELRLALSIAKDELSVHRDRCSEVNSRVNEIADKLAIETCPYSIGDDVLHSGDRFQITQVARSRWGHKDYEIYGKQYKKNGELYKEARHLYNGVEPVSESA